MSARLVDQLDSLGSLHSTLPWMALVVGLPTFVLDYEVFLLSRIREQYDPTGDNTAAVATGLQRTAGVITSAALRLLVVVGGFTTSGITFVKLTGVGMIVAVVVEATVVRALLVPATMRLLGRVNWWTPGPLRRVYARYGLRESDEPVPTGEAVGPVPPRRPGRGPAAGMTHAT